MTLRVPEEIAVGDDDRLLACFDITALRVYSTLCRVTVAHRRSAESLLTDTYFHLRQVAGQLPDHSIDIDWLVSAACQLYLQSVDAEQLGGPAVGDVGHADLFADSDWSQARWAPTLEALSALEPRTRVALDLCDVEQRTPQAIADLLQLSVDDVDTRLADARRALVTAQITEAPREAFGHAEIWLDDDVRDRVRAALTVASAAESPDRSRRNRRLATFAVAAVVGLSAVLIIRWVREAPADSATKDPAALSPPTAPTPTTVFTRQPSLVGDGSGRVRSFSMQLAADLTDQTDVRPDAIVRYTSSDAVGLSWTGPCNRPAASISFTGYTDGIGVTLRTGAFPVVSCLGMPRRWTVVIEHGLGDGEILPIVDDGLDHSFTAYSVDAHPPSSAVNARWFGSALVDQAGRPWLYVGKNCGDFGYVQRASPVGAIFEVRTGLTDREKLPSQAQTGTIDCTDSRIPKVLHGPDGSVFPQPNASLAAAATTPPPKDCHGPSGSPTDLSESRTDASISSDGDWSTWDGCLVGTDVIFSRVLPESCGWQSAHTITFAETLGQAMGPVSRTLTYVRDPGGVVPGSRPPLLHYEVMPGDAQDSGLRFGTDQLWTSPTTTSAVYVVTAADVERWPLLADPPRC